VYVIWKTVQFWRRCSHAGRLRGVAEFTSEKKRSVNIRWSLSFPLFAFVGDIQWHRGKAQSLTSCLRFFGSGNGAKRFLNGDTHMTTISTLAAIALVFANATLNTNARIFAPLTRSLAIATFFALTASLTARFGRQIFLIGGKLVLEIDCGC